MDFLDPKKKRNHRIRLFTGYILVGIGVLLATLILVFMSYGFDVDRESGDVIQKGLVFIDAQPESMDIYVNEGLIGDKTNARLLLPSGTYKLQLKKTGYRMWQRSFDLEGGSVERFAYPILFPEKITSTAVANVAATPAVFTSTPDRRQLLVSAANNPRTFTVMNMLDKNQPSLQISIPDSVVTQPQVLGTLSVVEWSNDNRHVLLKRTTDTLTEFVLFDIEQPELSVNVNRQFTTSSLDIRLIDKKADKFHVLEQDKSLKTADRRTSILSTAIATNVLQFASHGEDIVMYAAPSDIDATKVRVSVLENTNKYLLQEYAAGARYVMEVARFDSKWYFLTASSTENRALIFIEPLTELKNDPLKTFASPDTFLSIENAEYASFSANARFIAVQSGQKIVVYDAETVRKHAVQIEEPLPAGYEVKWMDGHRFTLAANDTAYVFEYDGLNKQALAGAASGQVPLFDRDYDALYTYRQVSPENPTFDIVRSELLLQSKN